MPRPKLTAEDRLAIRELYNIGRNPPPLSLAKIAEKFDVSTRTVWRTVRMSAAELRRLADGTQHEG